MTRVRVVSILGALALAACAEAPTPTSPALVRTTSQASVVDDGAGTYLVRFKGKGVPADFASTVASLGGEVIFAHAGVGIAAVSGLSNDAAATLAGRSSIAAVDPDAYTTLEQPASATVEGVPSVTAPADATDPTLAFFYARQWNMRAINAPAAWAAGKLGKATTRVGIIDTGIDYTAVDLAGHVDLASSVSFLSAAENQRVQDNFPGAHPIADLNYHGTHVASTVVSNGLVTAGVTSGVTLVGIKVCAPGTPANGFQGTCPTSGVLAGILYAADHGLDVANMSLGGNFNRRDASARGGFGPSFIATINAVFNYAYQKGTLMVVSAGNSAIDMDHDGNNYNAYCSAPHVVCVSATGPVAQAGTNGPWLDVDALAYYSNYGRSSITVAAPGGNNATAVWATCSHFSLALPICATGNFAVGLQGTSMAAPHVTGVAALIAGDVGHNPSKIESALVKGADDLGQPGTDPAYGKGRVNAAAALN